MRCSRLFSLVILVLSTFWLSDGSVRAQPNYDPSVPSPEFGTPEATARIAANGQSLDIVGVKLGMSLKVAQDAVKAHNSGVTLTPKITFEFEALPGTVMTPVYSGHGKTANGGSETLGVLLTSAPNEAIVYGVWRDVWFGAKETRPTIDYIMNGLRKKYGQESVREENTLLIWLYDV